MRVERSMGSNPIFSANDPVIVRNQHENERFRGLLVLILLQKRSGGILALLRFTLKNGVGI